MPLAILKQTYLECERQARVQRMGTGEVARCSEIYEELKLRAFGGDWMRLRVWTGRNLASFGTT